METQLLSNINYHLASRLDDQKEKGQQLKWLKCFVRMERKCFTMQTTPMNAYIWGKGKQSITGNRSPLTYLPLTYLPLICLSWIKKLATHSDIQEWPSIYHYPDCNALWKRDVCLQWASKPFTLWSCYFHGRAAATLTLRSRNMVALGSKLHAALTLSMISLLPQASFLIIFPSPRSRNRKRRRSRKRRRNKTKFSLFSPSLLRSECSKLQCQDLVGPVHTLSLCWNSIWHRVTAQ